MPLPKFHRTSNGEGQKHYVYDLALPLPERRVKRMSFPTALAAANYLGVTPQRIYANRKNRARVWSESLNGWFAVRVATTEKETTHE